MTKKDDKDLKNSTKCRICNHKTIILFHNLKNYDSHLTMQELCKFDFKINAILLRFGINLK